MDCVSQWERVAEGCCYLGGRFIVWLETHLSPNLNCRPAPNVTVMNFCCSCALYAQPLTHADDSLPLHVALTSRQVSRDLNFLTPPAGFERKWPCSPRPPSLMNALARILISSLDILVCCPRKWKTPTVNSGDSSLTHRGLCHINFANVSMHSATYSSDEEWWVVSLIE